MTLLGLDRFSKNGVGRTGFEPVTSSVSGNSGAVPSVCDRRAESNWEPVTCEKNLAGSRYVRGRLNTLAPISGSHSVWSTRESFKIPRSLRASCSSMSTPVSAPEPVVGEPGSQHVRADGGVAARPASVDPEMRKQTSGLCRYKSPRRPHMHVMPVIFPLLPAGCVRLPTETADTPMAGCILWRER